MAEIISSNAFFRGASIFVLAVFAALSGMTPATARDDGYEMITVQSQEDFRTVTVPVRAGRNGYEVRIPGGTWLECEYSCAYTVQNEYLDEFTCGTVFGEGGCSPGLVGDLLGRFR